METTFEIKLRASGDAESRETALFSLSLSLFRVEAAWFREAPLFCSIFWKVKIIT
jgi:hypothetical protein